MKDFVSMCKKIGSMTDYVQGGGGNASCKHGDNKMAIKASGFTIGDITETTGYVDVDYIKIKEYHADVLPEEMEAKEKESTPFTLSCVFPSDGPALRPSVETGFHSIMKKYVMHTHPVYTNVITCAAGGKELAEKIFKDIDFVWVPYINPGFSLTIAIREAITAYEQAKGVFPRVIFMENHGLVTTDDDAEACADLHIQINEAIKNYLGLNDFYTDLTMTQDGDKFVCSAPFVKAYFDKYSVKTMEENALYPDQLVYLNAGMHDGKIAFDGGKVILNAAKKEATAMLETFAAFAYVVDGIYSSGLTISAMDAAATGFINNWESEKYRKEMAKKG
ncbi:MAG: class II aldolase [Ruminococcaceae bacterium]|nr:class II aldolase [Oscillospiraceae bacterium]